MFRSAIVKVTAFCNLNCSYCYMFNQSDLTYLRVPKSMTPEVALAMLDRIVEHLDVHNTKSFHLALHGGEPTLWPVGSFAQLLTRIAQANETGLDIRTTVQTNAVRIPAGLLELFQEHGVHVGISIDGPQIHNDHWRVDHAGNGSYKRIMKTVSTMIDQGYGDLLTGFLCVSPIQVPPEEFLDWAGSLPIADVDVLWPMEYNYANPPWNAFNMSVDDYMRSPVIGQWFADLFDVWWERDDPSIRIRLFEDCIRNLLGAGTHVDNIVNDSITACVINTDGGIEYHDYFRSHRDGATRTEFNVVEHSFDQALTDAGFSFCQTLSSYLPSECEGCLFQSLCGGGFLPGRFRVSAEEFELPRQKSVLCYDEYFLFERILSRVMSDGGVLKAAS